MLTITKKIIDRVLEESIYILKTESTIRDTARIFKVSKSTVHKDMSERLKDIDNNLYLEIEKLMKKHIDTRHIKGGEATKYKYMLLNR